MCAWSSRTTFLPRLPAALAAGLLLAVASGAQGATAIGETVVPQTPVPVFDQPGFDSVAYQPALARTPDGRSVLVWTDADDAGKGVYARLYGPDGQPASDPIEVNNPTDPGDQQRPDVAVDADGNFVVVWQGPGVVVGSGPLRPLFYRRFDPAGNPLGGAVPVNGTTTADCEITGDGAFPSVLLLNDGTVGVGYVDELLPQALRVRAFNAADTCVAEDEELFGEVDTLSEPRLLAPREATLASIAAGESTVVGAWLRSNSGGTEVITEPVTFDPLAPDAAVVVSDGSGDVTDFDIALGPRGPVVVWGGIDAGDPSQRTVRVRRLNNDGTVIPAEPPATIYTGSVAPFGPPPDPQIAVDPATGTSTVVWVTLGAEDTDIMARVLDAAAAPLTPMLAVNDPALDAASPLVDGQENPAVAVDADGDPIIAWERGDNIEGIFIDGLEVAWLSGPEAVDLGVSLDDGGAPVAAGAALGYQVVVVNNHPGSTPTGAPAVDAQVGVATGIQVGLTLGEGVGFDGASNGDWDCGVTAPTTGQVDCDLTVALPPGGSSSTVLTVDLLAPSPGTVTGTAEVSGQQFDPVAANDTASVTTTITATDLVPDAFTLIDQDGVDPGAALISAPVTITGISAPAPISVSGAPSAAYSVDGDLFTSAPATVADGASVRVRVTASSTPGAVTNATLAVGGVEDTFTVTTRADAPPPEEEEATPVDLGGSPDPTPSSGGTGSVGWPLLLGLLGAAGFARRQRAGWPGPRSGG